MPINIILLNEELGCPVRSQNDFIKCFVNTSRFGGNSFLVSVSEACNVVLEDVKSTKNLYVLKGKKPCRSYIKILVF